VAVALKRRSHLLRPTHHTRTHILNPPLPALPTHCAGFSFLLDAFNAPPAAQLLEQVAGLTALMGAPLLDDVVLLPATGSEDGDDEGGSERDGGGVMGGGGGGERLPPTAPPTELAEASAAVSPCVQPVATPSP
jgi:hypothetical protein